MGGEPFAMLCLICLIFRPPAHKAHMLTVTARARPSSCI